MSHKKRDNWILGGFRWGAEIHTKNHLYVFLVKNKNFQFIGSRGDEHRDQISKICRKCSKKNNSRSSIINRTIKREGTYKLNVADILRKQKMQSNSRNLTID